MSSSGPKSSVPHSSLGRSRRDGRRRGTDRAFQHRAAIEADASGLGDGRNPCGRKQAAGLQDLEREDVSGLGLRHLEGRLRPREGFIRHDRDGGLAGEPGEAADVPEGHRLLDQVDARVPEQGKQAEAVASLQAWLMSTRIDARSPSAFLMAATWAMLAFGSPLPIFSLKIRWRRFASISSASAMSRPVSPLASVPGDGEPVMLASAEEVRDRESGALAHRIEQRALDRALCEMIALHGAADQRHGLADAGRVRLRQDGVM